jgi:uncharacterized protein (TIGR00661 family)
MKILYSLCSWGLGHATRALPVIRRFINDSHDVVIYTSGRSLSLLKSELKDNARFISSTAYPSPFSDKIGFAFRFVKTAPAIIKIIKEENLEISKIIRDDKIDIILSDSRFGSYSHNIPSFLIFHQLRFIAPFRFLPAEIVTEYYNHYLQDNFIKIIVPDYKDNSLSGDLSHNLRFFKPDKVEYIGILSDFEYLDVDETIDYLFSLSGPEPTRTILEEKVFAQLKYLKGKIAVALGKPGKFTKEVIGDTVIYSYLEKKRRDELMNRAKIVISRSGYTTIMDVAEINKKALFIPTPGQTEQIYLANYLKSTGKFYSKSQRKLAINEDIEEARKFSGYQPAWKTNQSVENLLNIINLHK